MRPCAVASNPASCVVAAGDCGSLQPHRSRRFAALVCSVGRTLLRSGAFRQSAIWIGTSHTSRGPPWPFAGAAALLAAPPSRSTLAAAWGYGRVQPSHSPRPGCCQCVKTADQGRGAVFGALQVAYARFRASPVRPFPGRRAPFRSAYPWSGTCDCGLTSLGRGYRIRRRTRPRRSPSTLSWIHSGSALPALIRMRTLC